MGKAIREHIRSSIVGYIAIFLFAMGGTATGGVGSAEVVDFGLSNQDISVFREDPMTDSNPENLWGNLFSGSRDCASPDRMTLHSTGGPIGGPYREVTVRDGDSVYGERCEMGNNEWRYGLASPTNRPGTFYLYQQGTRAVTSYWLRLGSDYPLSSSKWQVVTQMKQTQPSANGGGTPVISLEARSGKWNLVQSTSAGPSSNTRVLWSTPAQHGVWTPIEFDVTYSTNPAVGSIRLSVGGVQSPVFRTYTLKYETKNSTYLHAGDSIPSHLRVGVYHDAALGSTSVDVGPVQVVDVSPVQVAVP
jgi:hypothetical protein